MAATLADLEKQVHALKIAVDGKKDKKTAEQEWAKTVKDQDNEVKKIVAEQAKMNKSIIKAVELDAKFLKLESRIVALEAQVKVAIAMASK